MGRRVVIAGGKDENRAAVIGNPPDPIAWSEVKERARLHGLDLSDADARDLQPFYDQHQRWLEALRHVLGSEEEPATRFSAGDARDDRE